MTTDELCERLLTLAADCEIGESNYCVELADAAKEAGTTLRDLIQQQRAEIERLSAEKAEWQRQLGHDLPAWSMRQARVDLRTPLDTVFAGAIAAIETWGAHPDLTSAQSLVSRAWSFINRWIEEGASGASDEARAALGKDASDVRSQREGRGQ